MRVVRWVGISLVVAVSAVFGVGVVARFCDGPIGPFPGGPLRAGSLVSDPDVDWPFAQGLTLAELQLVEPPRSRTVGIFVHERHLYVSCDLGFAQPENPRSPLRLLRFVTRLKRWHQEVLRDGRVVLRVEGRRYELQAVRVTDPVLFAALSSLAAEQTEALASTPMARRPPDPDAIWFFRLEPRRSARPDPSSHAE